MIPNYRLDSICLCSNLELSNISPFCELISQENASYFPNCFIFFRHIKVPTKKQQ